jgi:hypothetical protein
VGKALVMDIDEESNHLVEIEESNHHHIDLDDEIRHVKGTEKAIEENNAAGTAKEKEKEKNTHFISHFKTAQHVNYNITSPPKTLFCVWLSCRLSIYSIIVCRHCLFVFVVGLFLKPL